MTRSYDLEFRLDRAKTMSRAMISKGWTRSYLAKKAGYDEKTIRNVLNGEPTRDHTIITVCKALEIPPVLEPTIENVDVSDDVFGGYNRSQHRGYESFYKLFRRSYSQQGRLFRSFFKIEWDPTDENFKFFEYYSHEVDGASTLQSHTGPVYMSAYTNLVHFVTTFQGSVRVATMTKMREKDGVMRGAVLTQSESITSFHPTFSSLVLRRLKDFSNDDLTTNKIGVMGPEDADYQFAKEQRELTEQQLIRTVLP